jgi:hypothetical protein
VKTQVNDDDQPRMLIQHVKTHLLNILIDSIVQNYSLNIDIKGKLKFKRVINSIVRDMPIENPDDEGNAELIQSGL